MIYRTKSKHRVALIAWFEEREKLFARMYEQAQVVIAVPDHHSQFDFSGDTVMFREQKPVEGKEDGIGVGSWPIAGSPPTPLPYGTLKDMTRTMIEQEDDRRAFTTGLKDTMGDLAQWEQKNPVPVYKPWWK